MKTKIICVVLSAFLLLPFFGFSAYAVTYPEYTLDEWKNLTREEIQELMSSICTDNGTTYQGTTNDINGMSGYLLWKAYRGLAGFEDKSYNGLTTFDGRTYAEMMLEMYHLADFGRGLYDNNGHTSGSFGDEVNDVFEDFEKQYPYSGISSGTAYQFENGYYITWEPMYSSNGSMNFSVNGETHRKTWYKIRFYLHDETGKLIDMYIHSHAMSCICDTCQKEPFENFTLTQNGTFFYTFYNNQNVHLASPEISNEFDIPWYSTYGPVQEVEPPVSSIPVVLYDDNGNAIYCTKNGDYITYEGNTYNYDNGTVNIGGNEYHYYYDYTNMPDEYLNQFYNYVYNYYTSSIGSDYNFDDSAILAALKSIYDKICNVITNIQLGIDNIVGNIGGSLNRIWSKLDEILHQLKTISNDISEITKEEEEKNSLAWLNLINDFKNKVGWSSLEKSVENIKTAFFGDRVFTENENGGVDVDIITEEQDVIHSKLPNLYITVNGSQYNLYGCLGSLGDGIATIKLFISSFLWIGFIVAVFRSVPAIIGGVASVQDQSNNVVIDKHTGEVKRGG